MNEDQFLDEDRCEQFDNYTGEYNGPEYDDDSHLERQEHEDFEQADEYFGCYE